MTNPANTRFARLICVAATLFISACGQQTLESPNDPHIDSLADISISELRERKYGSTLNIEKRVGSDRGDSYLVSYLSDGLRIYARADVPSSTAPEPGYPVIVFAHGWAGIDAAPDLDFYYGDDSTYGRMIEAYVDAGFVVFAPGFRGHGTVDGVPADGIEFMRAWDNGSYLSPAFYAIDVLNLVEGLGTFEKAQLNLDNVNLVAHSQGGDVALIALAVSGEGSNVINDIAAASIWSGCFPTRLTQLETYHPMATSPEAFMSGDGTWNGTAVGADGSVNPNFVFGFPADWIGSVDRQDWTWQNDTWTLPSVAEAQRAKLEQMYDAINTYVTDIDGAHYELVSEAGSRIRVTHDTRVLSGLAQIDAFDKERFLTEALLLHHSDRDYYSFPAWNADLCERINASGGQCQAFEYAENTHSLGISKHRWFSSENAEPGFNVALQRDIDLFR